MSSVESSLAGLLLVGFMGAPLQDAAPGPTRHDPPPDTEEIHRRMRELVLKIEADLRNVDEVLWKADPAAENGPALGATLREASERAQQVVDDIDHLLELTFHSHDPGGGGT